MSSIIGISAYFHDSACCLLRDGKLNAAAQEESFSRRKHDPALPKAALRYCLEQGGITISDVDCIAYYEDPYKKVGRQTWMHGPAVAQIEVAIASDGSKAAGARDSRKAGL